MRPRKSRTAILIILLLIVIFSGQISLGLLQTGDPFEPNNALATATPITLPFSSQLLGIEPSSDEDYFVFTLDEPAFMSIDVDAESIGSKLDAVLIVLDEDGDSIALSDDADGSDPALQIRLPKGRHYVLVAGFFGISSGPYRIRVEKQDLGDCLKSELPAQGFETWSLGPVEPGSRIRLFLSGPEATDFDLFLIEVISNNPPLSAVAASGKSLSSNETLTYDVKGSTAREFLVRVEAFEGEGSYTLCRSISKGAVQQ